MKFQLRNREAQLIAGLLTAGLENLRLVSRSGANYYQSFYDLSIGLERLCKLILHLGTPSGNLRGYGHNLAQLMGEINCAPRPNTIEEDLVNFLDNFAKGGRYSILDNLSGAQNNVSNEPIWKFYDEILKEIIQHHPLDNIKALPEGLPIFARHTSEDYSIIDDYNGVFAHGQEVEHVAKYAVMYMGRVLRPVLKKLGTYDAVDPDTPFLSEHFKYLEQDDTYFLKRKTYHA